MAARKGEAHGQVNPETGLNHRQELFAQYIVAGRTLADAVRLAGYQIKEPPSNPRDLEQKWTIRGTRLRKLSGVAARIDHLMAEQAEVIAKQRNALSDKFQMNIEKLTIMLLEDRHFARTGELSLPGAAPVKDHTKGPDWRSDARAAVQASMGLAKLHGLLIDKAEVTVQGSISRMSNEELLQFIHKVHTEIGPVVELTASTLPDYPPPPNPRRMAKPGLSGGRLKEKLEKERQEKEQQQKRLTNE